MQRRYAVFAVAALSGGLVLSALAQACGGRTAGSADEPIGTVSQAQTAGDEQPQDPTQVPKFAQALPIPEVWTGTPVIQNGQVVQVNYTLTVVQATQQMLPPASGVGPSTVLAYRASPIPKAPAKAPW